MVIVEAIDLLARHLLVVPQGLQQLQRGVAMNEQHSPLDMNHIQSFDEPGHSLALFALQIGKLLQFRLLPELLLVIPRQQLDRNALALSLLAQLFPELDRHQIRSKLIDKVAGMNNGQTLQIICQRLLVIKDSGKLQGFHHTGQIVIRI